MGKLDFKSMKPEAPESPEFDDLSAMPFGKYKGEVMQDVPAYWLCWLWNENNKEATTPVLEYIESRLDDLESEYPKGEWR